jgi:hypothetical protein
MVCANSSDRRGRGGGIGRDVRARLRRTGAARGGRPAPNLITSEEIATRSVQNALEAVQKLRPAMLKRPTVASANAAVEGRARLYVDNTRFGSGAVENLPPDPGILDRAVRYFSASESQMNGAPTILVGSSRC